MQNMTAYVMVTTVCTILLVWWALSWLFNPFQCICGFRTRFRSRFRKHLQQGHRWHEPPQTS